MREYLMPIFVAASLLLAGCNKSKSPEDVSKDVAKAEQKANNEVTKSEERAQSALDKSYEKVNDQEIKFNNDAAHQTYNVAIAKADGDRKVALATCESQSGDHENRHQVFTHAISSSYNYAIWPRVRVPPGRSRRTSKRGIVAAETYP